jgi:arylsulfatase A-like enzyme
MTSHTSNVVLVTVDSLRADAIGSTGDTTLTPALDALASDGAVFENAFAHGNWTPFSFPGIMASRPVFATSAGPGLPPTPTVAERLREAGFRTGGFNAANGFVTSQWGYDRGFDAFESFVPEPSSAYGRYLAAHPTVQGWLQLATSPFRRAANWLRGGGDDYPFTDTSRMLDVERHATDFIERGGDEPFFLWVHYMDAHTPYMPAPRYLRSVSGGRVGTHRMIRAHASTGLGREVDEDTLADLRTLYDAAVRQIDDSMARIRAALDRVGVADDTAIVVAGDHGEEFMEHGHLAHYPKLYDELVRVPVLVSGPSVPQSRVEEPVGLDAVPPTVCELAGVEPADAWQGHSVADPETVADQSPIVSVTVRGESVTSQPIPRRLDEGDLLASARTAEWTLIENRATGHRELYDGSADPDQVRDLWGTDAAEETVVERLSAAIDDHVATLGAVDEQGEAPTAVEGGLARRLEALGYR